VLIFLVVRSPLIGLLPLRAFDQRHGLTRGLAGARLDDRDDSRMSHPGLSLLRQRSLPDHRCYEDANDADGYVTIRRFRFCRSTGWVNPSGHNQLSAAGRTRPRLAISQALQGALLDLVCENLRETGSQTGEILLDVDSTRSNVRATAAQFLHGGYDQHM